MTTSGCATYADLAPLAAQGMLPPADQARFDAHLPACAACQAAMRAHQALDVAFARYVNRPADFPRLSEDIMASVSRDTQDPTPRRAAFTGILPWAAVALIALLAALLFTSHLAATSPGSGKSHTLPACLSTFTPTPAVYPQGTPTSAPGATPAPTNTATTSSGSVHKTLAPSPTDCAPPPTNTPGATPTPADKPGPTPTPKVYP